TAQAINDFNKGEQLPLMIFANWRGFSGELRGGAWVVIDPTINDDMIEMYADAKSRADVLEPQGIVEIKFRKSQLLATRKRFNLQILHDTPGRMKSIETIRTSLELKESRRFFYWRVRRRIIILKAIIMKESDEEIVKWFEKTLDDAIAQNILDMSEINSKAVLQGFEKFFETLSIEERNNLLRKLTNAYRIINDFGLRELLLNNNDFLEEFEQFCSCDDPKLYKFPNLYDLVKSNIYFIVIHQQQVEGLFNKIDLKTHPNMSPTVKQSKLHLSSGKIAKENLNNGLKDIRKQRTKPRKTPLQEVQFRPNTASTLLKQILDK
ncbi:13463_t:CDS:2, partial [Funneliformis geosporum]